MNVAHIDLRTCEICKTKSFWRSICFQDQLLGGIIKATVSTYLASSSGSDGAIQVIVTMSKPDLTSHSKQHSRPSEQEIENTERDDKDVLEQATDKPLDSSPANLRADDNSEAHPVAAQTGIEAKEGLPVLKRSTRKRVPTYREPGTSDEDSPPANAKKVSPNAQPRRQPIRGNWSTHHLMTNSHSKLAGANLMAMLSSSLAWDCLSPAQQSHLLLMLPDHAQSAPSGSQGPDLPRPNYLRDHLKSSAAFQADVRFFQEDLAAGRYEPQWLKDAERAMKERANGDFDDWKEAHREAFWGQKQKVAWNAIAGESSVHDLATLVAAGLVQVGDIWRLEWNTRPPKGEEAVQIEKEATITAIAQDHSLSFSFPPGQHKFSSHSYGEDLQVTNVTGPSRLIKSILEEDGRTGNQRLANAWKALRCVRKNQDMGSLWDVRELYHQQRSSKTT